jgi:hypothetical protein
MTHKFEIIEKSWFKRRTPRPEPKPVSVEIPDYKQERNHFCDMHVTYDDGSTKTLLSRVVQNHIKKHWIVDGMEVSVLVIQA